MNLKKVVLLFSLLSIIVPSVLQGQQDVPKKREYVSVKGSSGNEAIMPVEVAEKIKKDVQTKKSVMTQMMRLFLESKPPVLLNTKKLVEAKPEFSIVAGTDGMSTLIYRARYLDPEYMTDVLDSVVTDMGYVELVKKLGAEVNEYSQVVVHDKSEKMDEIKNIILAIDQLRPQVLVEAQVIEIYSEQGAERDVSIAYTYTDADKGTTNNIGFNFDSPVQNRDSTQGFGGSFTPYVKKSSDGSIGKLDIALRMLDTGTSARVLSSPNVIADQGTEASITTAEELPIPETAALTSSTNLSFTFKQVGVTLKFTPLVINEKTVQLEVNPQVRSVLRYETFVQNDVKSPIPVISVRSIDTRLTVADGDVIILGGLYNSEQSLTLKKMPFIGDLPVIGDMVNGRASSTTDKQLLFVLKVHIIHPANPVALDLENVANESHKLAHILKKSRSILTNKPASEFVDVEGLINEEAKRRAEKRENQQDFFKALDEFLYSDLDKEAAERVNSPTTK